jgi:5-phospho-D-xylono-1,4-lactonase
VSRFVRTVVGDIDPNEVGVTYCHEHLIIDSPFIAARFPHIHLDSVEAAVSEVTACREAGANTMVDTMPSGQGRDLGRLAVISRQTGVHIIGASGLHTAKYYEGVPWAEEESAPDLAERFTDEIVEGADGTSYRCGVLKVASGPEGVDGRARRLFEAAAIAHQRTGAPIITHCEDGHHGLQQVELLASLGVGLDRVLLSHTDKVVDIGYHRELLQTGVNLGYDRALRQPLDDPAGTAWLIGEMVAAGFSDRLMLGTDGARRTLWSAYGGSPGLARLLTDFVPSLQGRGVDERTIRRLLVENPRRWLTFLSGLGDP